METDRELLLWFLDKNYVLDIFSQFATRYDDKHEWGWNIIYYVSKILDLSESYCYDVFREWAEDKGVIEDYWEHALGARKLKTNFSPELAQDASNYFATKKSLVELLSYEIGLELQTEVFKDLKLVIKTVDEFLSIVKCLGYSLGVTIYNPENFIPIRCFMSISNKEMINEQQNNPHWQNWVRTREQNQEA